MPQTAPLALAALVTGLLGVVGVCLCLLGGLVGAVGIVCGVLALRQITAAHGRLTGRGFAIGGIVAGAVALLLVAVLLVVLLSGGATDLFRIAP